MKPEITMSARQTPATQHPLLDVADGPTVASDNFGEMLRGEVPDPGGAVAQDSELADVRGTAAAGFAGHQDAELAGGAKVAR
jgi:hypothetical protein